MLAVTGFRTSIVQELKRFIDDPIVRIGADLGRLNCTLEFPPADRFVLAAGVLHQTQLIEQSPDEIMSSLAVNMINTVRLCELILKANDNARIVVIGSESADRGSFDTTYALAKAGVHAYARWKQVLPTQQLTVLAPPIIADSGMTRARKDYPEVLSRRRTVTAEAVARSVKSLLYTQPAGSHGVAYMVDA
mgnify:CR=1 FL=1